MGGAQPRRGNIHSWFPYEHHSTGLWGINYLPDRLAHAYARWASPRDVDINRSPDWSVHLRGGLRGGSEREVLKLLGSADARILRPLSGDRAAYWLNGTSARLRPLKRAVAAIFRWSDRLFATVPSMNLDVAIGKGPKREPLSSPRAAPTPS